MTDDSERGARPVGDATRPDPSEDERPAEEVEEVRREDPAAPALGVVQPDHELDDVPEPSEPG